MKRIFVLLTLAIFVVANVGIAVYTHSCSISGTEKSYFIQAADPCSDEHPVKEKTCCVNTLEDEVHFEKSCCNTDAEFVGLSVDARVDQSLLKVLLSDLQLAKPLPNFTFKAIALDHEVDECSAIHYMPPPLWQGRTLTTLHDCYLI